MNLLKPILKFLEHQKAIYLEILPLFLRFLVDRVDTVELQELIVYHLWVGNNKMKDDLVFDEESGEFYVSTQVLLYFESEEDENEQ